MDAEARVNHGSAFPERVPGQSGARPRQGLGAVRGEDRAGNTWLGPDHAIRPEDVIRPAAVCFVPPGCPLVP